MTTNLRNKIEEILRDYEPHNDAVIHTSANKIFSAIREEIPEKVEERPMTINFPITDSDDDEIERKKMILIGHRQGFNQAIDDMLEKLK